jgi:hypothetical protein
MTPTGMQEGLRRIHGWLIGHLNPMITPDMWLLQSCDHINPVSSSSNDYQITPMITSTNDHLTPHFGTALWQGCAKGLTAGFMACT